MSRKGPYIEASLPRGVFRSFWIVSSNENEAIVFLNAVGGQKDYEYISEKVMKCQKMAFITSSFTFDWCDLVAAPFVLRYLRLLLGRLGKAAEGAFKTSEI
jgi:hypothetical protein